MEDLFLIEEPAERLSHSVLSQYLAAIVTFLTGSGFYIFLIRFYSTEVVGTFALIQAINMLLPILFTVGLPPTVQHMISFYYGKRDTSKVMKILLSYFYLSFIMAALSIGGVVLLAPYLSLYLFHSSIYTLLIIVLSVAVALNIISLLAQSILLGVGNFKKGAYVVAMGSGIGYLTAILMILYNHNSTLDIVYSIVYGLIAGGAVSTSMGIVFVIQYVKKNCKTKINVTAETFYTKEILKYSMPLFISSILGYGAGYVDRFVVAFFINLSDLGIYNLALIIATSTTFIATPFTNILITKFSKYYGESFYDESNKSKIGEGVRLSSIFLSLIFIPVAVGIAAISPMILYLIGGSNYLRGTYPLIIITFSLAFCINLFIFTTVLYGLKKTNLFIISGLMSVLSNVLFSILLIPRYNILGASLSFSSTYFVSFFILFYFLKKENVAKIDYVTISKIWLASVVMFFTVIDIEYFLGRSLLMILPYMVIGALIFTGIIKLTSAINKNDLDLFIDVIPDRLRWFKKIIPVLFL